MADDVREDKISRGAGREQYGVVVDELGDVDVAATAELRSSRTRAAEQGVRT